MFKKLLSKLKKEKPEEKSLLENTNGYLLFTVDDEGIISLDFGFDTDSAKSNELFSEMFHQLNSGQLMKTGISFISNTLEKIESKASEDFIENIEILEQLKDNIFLNAITRTPEINLPSSKEEVVVKPTDIASTILKDEHK
jgi:ArsR family metal-binding transcriptional regulator|tara:strand:+ start:805 stop:1227 length:423 start_codon:yes stop_codon:yes gene_type:complete